MKARMIMILCFSLLCLLCFSTGLNASVVTDWNEAALAAIRASNTPPPAASRNLAILHASIYDAVNGITRTHEPYLVTGNVPASSSTTAAAASAARTVLLNMYPSRQPALDTLYQDSLSKIPDGPQKLHGIEWGQFVALQILMLRSGDGSGTTVVYTPSLEPGRWRPTISFGGIVRPALLPQWGNVRPFGVDNIDIYVPAAPPALASPEYAAEVNFVKALGGTASLARTPDQTQMALFWGYGPMTATPPGHWNQIATVVSTARGNSLEQDARLYALLNIAMADAAIASWKCKYAFDLWRPITAIQLADTDGNPATSADPTWTPLLATPPFPEYTSGHSTFSGAAAIALARFFGSDNVAFSVGSDDLPGIQRSYESFSGAAAESGLSRLYGGIHFPSANQFGLSSGRDIGSYVSSNLLLSKRNRSRP